MSRPGPVRLRVALPWFEPAADAFGAPEVRLPAAEWLAARGEAPVAVHAPWRVWLTGDALAPAGGLERHAAGPCLRALDGDACTGQTWAALRPVHLLAAIDHLQVADRPVDLDAGEAEAIAADLGRHFAADGLVFRAGSRRDWLLGIDREVRCDTCAPDGLPGRNLRELMPRGEHAAAVSSFMNEVQMLLHEHPVNLARAARGAPPVNALWPWGYGRVAAHAPLDLPALCTDDDWLAGAWRVHGATALGTDALEAVLRDGVRDVLVAWSQPAAAAALERGCFEPAVQALGRGDMVVDLLIGGRSWRVDWRARRRFWRRRRPLAETLA